MAKILLVEDEMVEAMNLKRSLQSMGYDVMAIASYGEEAIEKAINCNYRDNCLDSKSAFAQVAEMFGTERLKYVLAVTVRQKDWDGRISHENKAWAKTVPVADNQDAFGSDRNCYFVVDQAHTGLVDLLVTYARKQFAAEKDAPVKKPSVLDKLQSTPSVPKSSAVKGKDMER